MMERLDNVSLSISNMSRSIEKIYLLLVFYLSYLLYYIQKPFKKNHVSLENQIKPKAIIDGLMENFTGEDCKLINPNESVEETFLRIIKEKKYDSAMKLAKKFDLEMDHIYKSMWHHNEKSVALIDECLTKITQPLWTLNECVNCIPTQLKVVKHLLQFGIDVSKNLSIDSSNDDNEDSIHFTRFKNTLSNYLDKLKLYEKILNVKFGDDYVDHFDSNFFSSFRQKSTFHLAIEYANKADIEALYVLFEYGLHEEKNLAQHFLVVLSNLPETLSPFNYKSLIEYVYSTLFHWDHVQFSNDFDEFENDFYLNNVNYLKFKVDSKIDTQQLISWFEYRAREILDYTCLVNNSLDLLKIGIENNLPVENLYAELDLYSLLIYDSFKANNVAFEDFEKLSITKKMNLFFNNKNVILIENLFEKFFEKINDYSRLKKFNVTKKELLKNFFLNLTKIDFEQCLKIFEIYTMVDRTQEEIKCFKIINDPIDLIELALECINSYEGHQNLNVAFKIMECLPDRDQAHLLIGNDDEKIERFNKINDEADEIEYRLCIIELFKKYNTLTTVKDLGNVSKSDKNQQILFVEKVINNFCKQKISEDILDEWRMFFLNLKDLKKKYLNHISDEELVETAVKCLLLSSNENFIEIAFNHIDLESKVSSKKLNCEKGKSILKNVARDYIKFSNQFQDNNIRFAKMCLDVIHTFDPVDIDVIEELNFIEALKILYEEFEFHLLPIKIKSMSETDLLEAILSNQKNAHTKVKEICKIFSLLKKTVHYCNSNLDDDHKSEARLLNFIGQKAIENDDLKTAIDLCYDIMDRNLTSAWKLCHHICMLSDFDSLLSVDQQLRILSFVLSHCPDNDINMYYDLLNMIKNIKEIHINHITEQKVFINFRGTSVTQC